MTLVSSIRTALSAVGRKFADGIIEYRSLTSAPNTKPRTYTSWTSVPYARTVDFSESQIRDEQTGVWYRLELCTLRVPYEANVTLTIRDQVRFGTTAPPGAQALVWAVHRQVGQSAGSVNAYELERRTPMLTDPRQGGV